MFIEIITTLSPALSRFAGEGACVDRVSFVGLMFEVQNRVEHMQKTAPVSFKAGQTCCE
jgi:uncharacterized cupredoxin-like copper-binding protein